VIISGEIHVVEQSGVRYGRVRNVAEVLKKIGRDESFSLLRQLLGQRTYPALVCPLAFA
jgi:hypothetical protein